MIRHAEIRGPANSHYEGGVFHFDLTLPPCYPFKPPVVRCKTKIFHLLIDENGQICIAELHHEWSPAHSIETICAHIWTALHLQNYYTKDSAKYHWEDYIGGAIVDPDLLPGYISKSNIECIIDCWWRDDGSKIKGNAIPDALIKAICEHVCYQSPRMVRCYDICKEDQSAYPEIARRFTSKYAMKEAETSNTGT